MLFQGEEWGAKTPFQFFTNHNPELGEAVKKGRRAEFAEHGWNTEDVPDPQDPETFRRSKLNWSESLGGEHAKLLDWYKALIWLRRTVPEFANIDEIGKVQCTYDDEKRWLFVCRGERVATVINLNQSKQIIPIPGHLNGTLMKAQVLLASGEHGIAESGVAIAGESVAIFRFE